MNTIKFGRKWAKRAFFAAVGAAAMSVFWLYTDWERVNQELAKCELHTAEQVSVVIDAKAEAELLKK